uniref:Metalloendopeptidase n=1 Tax=Steinernema glaseri TaxID=37863 RepID=A0A1I8AGF6_9BILA
MRSLIPILLFVVATSAYPNKRAAFNRDNFPEGLWPTDRPIPYMFTSDFSYDDRPGMKAVLNAIASKTCLSFVESSTQSNESTVVFQNSTGCSTETHGRPSDSLTLHISLAESRCRWPVIYYDLMLFALGMYDTHVRPDRDDYISVHEEDIEPAEADRFIKKSNFSISTYDVPYDFDSLKHMSPDRLQKTEGIPTMVAKDPLYQFGMGVNSGVPSHSDYLLLNRLYGCIDRCASSEPGMGINSGVPSQSDYLLLNRLYGCLDRCASSEVMCQNGGFLNPNDCTKCICPRGFAGRSCNGPDYHCAGYEQSTEKWRRLSVDWSSIDEAKVCHWFLSAPPGRKIEIQLENIVPEDPLCPRTRTWLEVRLGNFVVGGYKFFCNGHIPNHTLISEGNLTVLTLRKYVDEPIEFELLFRNVEAMPENAGSTFRIPLALFFVAVTTSTLLSN